MYKFKFILLFLFLPMSYLIYYLTSYENGINAILAKNKELKNEIYAQKILLNDIEKIKKKIKLLDRENIDLDLLSEKSLEILGKTFKGSIVINPNNL